MEKDNAGFNHNRKKTAECLQHYFIPAKKKNTRKFFTQDFIGRIEVNESRILLN